MASRYDKRRKFRNVDPLYENIFEERGVNSIVQYTTPTMKRVTRAERSRLDVMQKRWVTGDRLYKLAAEHYGSSRYWWVIARFNYKPTDAHFKVGDTVYIPLPRETIFDIYGV
mgnify:FL=1